MWCEDYCQSTDSKTQSCRNNLPLKSHNSLLQSATEKQSEENVQNTVPSQTGVKFMETKASHRLLQTLPQSWPFMRITCDYKCMSAINAHSTQSQHGPVSSDPVRGNTGGAGSRRDCGIVERISWCMLKPRAEWRVSSWNRTSALYIKDSPKQEDFPSLAAAKHHELAALAQVRSLRENMKPLELSWKCVPW